MQKNKSASAHTSSLRKVKSTTRKKNKCVSGRKRGRTTRKGCLFLMEESTRLQEEADAAFYKQFGSSFPDRDVSRPKFEEQQFGSVCEPDQDNWCQLSKTIVSPLSVRVVSIALFDGDEMLFACTGIALPRGTSRLLLRRFLTSSHLITVFEQMRRKNDKLKVAVRLPNKTTIAGILGLYDKYIAIVTSLGSRGVRPVDLYQETSLSDSVVAVGRAYESCNLMGAIGALENGIEEEDVADLPIGVNYEDLLASTCQITEAGLGGPLVDLNGKFVGLNICFRFHNNGIREPLFLPWNLLRQRLENYKILNPCKRPGGIITPYCAGFSTGETNNSSQESYAPPIGASRIIPAGHLHIWNWLEFMGYPKPPPLMLELNGRLRRSFEDVFGWLRAWKGYKFGIPDGHGKDPWKRLDKKIVATISRRVVSLVSFTGDNKRFFSCTGFLVSTVGSRTRFPHSTVVTCASLVRTSDATDTIDEKMRIEVFLPPNQRLNGTLHSYHSGYNIAVVTVKGLHNIHPEVLDPCSPLPESVVAIGREPEGLLCASMGELVNPKGINNRKMDDWFQQGNFQSVNSCRKLERSTCKIAKVGIGGPLIDLATGCIVGMNFYDGKPGRTPYIPIERICDVILTQGIYDSTITDDHSVLRMDTPDEENHSRYSFGLLVPRVSLCPMIQQLTCIGTQFGWQMAGAQAILVPWST